MLEILKQTASLIIIYFCASPHSLYKRSAMDHDKGRFYNNWSTVLDSILTPGSWPGYKRHIYWCLKDSRMEYFCTWFGASRFSNRSTQQCVRCWYYSAKYLEYEFIRYEYIKLVTFIFIYVYLDLYDSLKWALSANLFIEHEYYVDSIYLRTYKFEAGLMLISQVCDAQPEWSLGGEGGVGAIQAHWRYIDWGGARSRCCSW